jgi:hypothetical protein
MDGTAARLRIFLNYRRDDSAGYALSLYRDLAERFGDQHVFMDIDTIAPGENFVERIAETLAACDVVVAMIGRDWLEASDDEGRRRLNDPEDFVRLELANALTRSIPVVPALVHGARLPRKADLPEELQPLVLRQAVELRDSSWRDDVARLIEDFEQLALRTGRPLPARQPEPETPPRPGRFSRLAHLLRRRWKIAVPAVAAAIVLSGSSAPPLGDPGQIAFLNDGILSKMDQDGGSVTLLLDDPLSSTGYAVGSSVTFTVHPSWSPDRRSIAFAKDGDIWVLTAGGKMKDLTNTPTVNEDSPAWSPDGRSIAYGAYSTTDSCANLCERVDVMSSNGSHQTVLAGTGALDYAPAWSPDGKLLAFVSTKDRVGDEQQNIWVMDRDGTNPRQVTRLRGYNGRPTWSPDGRRIAFESDASAADFATCDRAGTCLHNIVVVDARGTTRPTLVTNPDQSAKSQISNLYPAWLTSNRLVFTSYWGKTGNNDTWAITAINADGTNRQELTFQDSAHGTAQWPAVAP